MHEVPEHPGVSGKKIAPKIEIKHYHTGNSCPHGCKNGKVIREAQWIDGVQQKPVLFCNVCETVFHRLPGK